MLKSYLGFLKSSEAQFSNIGPHHRVLRRSGGISRTDPKMHDSEGIDPYVGIPE